MVYLDNAASTPPSEAVLDCFKENALSYYANQESIHQAGYAVRKKLDVAADELLKALDFGEKSSVLWVGSGTEGINTVFANPCFNTGNIVTTDAEHAALDESLAELSGCEIRKAALKSDGTVDLSSLASLLDDKTVAVAIHHVQSETGVIQDLEAIRCVIDDNSPKAKFVVDTIQSVAKVTVPFRAARVDYCFIAGHKIGCPFGAAVVYRDQNGEISKYFKSLRSDRHGISRPEPGVVISFVEGVKIALKQFADENERIRSLNEALRSGLQQIKLAGGVVALTLAQDAASPYIVHFTVPGFQAAVLLRFLASRGVMISSGSACEAETNKPSRALTAMGFNKSKAFSALRVSFWNTSSEEDVVAFVNELQAVIDDY